MKARLRSQTSSSFSKSSSPSSSWIHLKSVLWLHLLLQLPVLLLMGVIYCKPHFAQLFKMTDSLDKSFEVVVQFLDANFVSWGGLVDRGEGLHMATTLCPASFPLCGIVAPAPGNNLVVLQQIAKAVQYIRERGVAHLNVKPDNIYVKNDRYKLGDFRCATLLDTSLPIEEGDARYMPQKF